MPRKKTALFLMIMGTLSAPAAAQAPATLQHTVKSAIVNNPEVQARWHAFQASLHEQNVARGGYFPRLDFSTGVGRESLTEPGLASSTFTRRGATLSLNQMIFDGFATRDEVARLGYAKLLRYYEVLDTSESIALEASRAFIDVLRYRELSRLAQENLAQHEQVYNQIQQRVQAGVGRRVDFEQAGGRLALAQSNLLTETSNLHNVSSRYQRIVGQLPPGEMSAPALLKQGIPPNIEQTLRLAYQGSPVFNAAIENVRAAQAESRGRQANFLPRVDLRASKNIAFNDNGVAGRRNDQAIELVLNYNLFKGGSDQAQSRQYVERLKQSQDIRDKTCRDIRQTLTIAFNDIQHLTHQLGFLEQHQLSIEKAREAYRKQYDIGQRTLLDLLDTENEYFQARRAYSNATYEHSIAHVRTLAGMGKLLSALQVGRDGLPSAKDLGQDRFEVDAASQCPAVGPATSTDEVKLTPQRIAEGRAPLTAQPVVVAQPAVVALPSESATRTLTNWAAAWSSKSFARYMDYYASSFTPEGARPQGQWANERQARLALPGEIKVDISDVKLSQSDASKNTTEFKQTYSRANYRDVVVKRIEWIREGNRWKIQREQVLSIVSAAKP